jgi:hypothetical protein
VGPDVALLGMILLRGVTVVVDLGLALLALLSGGLPSPAAEAKG